MKRRLVLLLAPTLAACGADAPEKAPAKLYTECDAAELANRRNRAAERVDKPRNTDDPDYAEPPEDACHVCYAPRCDDILTCSSPCDCRHDLCGWWAPDGNVVVWHDAGGPDESLNEWKLCDELPAFTCE